jgi:hypothetical protein
MSSERERLLKLIEAQKRIQEAAKKAAEDAAKEEKKRKTGQKA